jgi:hypothetical protein
MGSSITLEGRCGGIDMSKAKNNEKGKEQEAVIYCGASLSAGTLQQYSVFVNGIPEHLNEHIEKCPAIKSLFVPISKFQEVRKRIEEPGTAEHTLNAQILAYVRSGE